MPRGLKEDYQEELSSLLHKETPQVRWGVGTERSCCVVQGLWPWTITTIGQEVEEC